MKQPAIYIMASGRNGTLYVGVTSDLVRGVGQHRAGVIAGFTAAYGCKALVYFELFDDMGAAIAWERQLKAGSRWRKLALIERENPRWRDLWGEIL